MNFDVANITDVGRFAYQGKPSYNGQALEREGSPMTVCIAAICTQVGERGAEYPMIVGASDRRYTAGDWTYEPPQTKRYNLTPNVTVLISGSPSTSTSICHAAHVKLYANMTDSVDEMAEMYASAYAEYRRREAERALLVPLGLSLGTYRKERENFVRRMDDELRRYELGDSAIIAGIGLNAARLYTVVDPGWAINQGTSGFATIGSGGRHAAAEFMRARYQRSWSPARAMLLVYRAKKAAEVDPYVGTETDMFVIGQFLPTAPLRDTLFDAVEHIHKETMDTEERATADANEWIEDYVTTFLAEQAQEAIDEGPVQAEDRRLDEGGGTAHPEDDEDRPPEPSDPN